MFSFLFLFLFSLIALGLGLCLAVNSGARAAIKKAFWQRAITVLAALLDTATRSRNWASAAVHSRCDLCWRSRRLIPLSGGPTGAAFTVAWAPSPRELRAVAWLYRTVACAGGPSAEDWRECIRAFGLADVPDYVLTAPAVDGVLICAVSINLMNDRYTVTHMVAGTTESWERPIVLGSLTAVELLSRRHHTQQRTQQS